MESVLFGMFVIAIACDQFEAIFSDETLVEQAKKQVTFIIINNRFSQTLLTYLPTNVLLGTPTVSIIKSN